MKIKIAMGHFWIEFDNGYQLSVVNNFGSHTKNGLDYEKWEKIIFNRDITASWTSEEVEVAIIDKKGDYATSKILVVNSDTATISVKELISLMNLLNLMKGEE